MVSIIIVNFNTKKLLESCLNSIFQHLKTLNFEVIVADNASVDGSVDMLRSKFKQVIRIENEENAGFAKANNQAAKIAKGSELVFLNSDAEILDDGIIEMVEFLKRHLSCGVVGGAFLNSDKSYQKSFGSFFSVASVLEMLIFGRRQETLKKTPARGNVDWVSGGFMTVSAELFKELGGFDENLFMYVEDMELCYRIRKMGKDVVYFPDASALHVGQGSSNRTFAIVHIYKGILYFFRKHKNMIEYIIVLLLLWLKAIFAIAIGSISRDTYLISTYRKALSNL